MTRDEAITYIVPLRKDAERDDDSYRTEALNMAIEALQTPPISQRRMYQLGYIQGQEDALFGERSEE